MGRDVPPGALHASAHWKRVFAPIASLLLRLKGFLPIGRPRRLQVLS